MERVLSGKKKPDDINIASDEEIRALNQDITTLRGTIYSFKQQTQDMIAILPKPVLLEADTSSFNKEIAALVPERALLTTRFNQIEEQKVRFESELNKIPFLIEKHTKTEYEISRLVQERLHIVESQCPTCMQQWVGDSAQAKIGVIEVELKALIAGASALKESIHDQPKLKISLDRLLSIRESTSTSLLSLQDQRASLDAKKYQLMELTSKQNQEAKDAYNKQISEIENKTRDSIDTCNKTMKEIEIQLSAKESQRNSYLIATAQYLTEVASINDMISKKQQEAVQTSLELQSIRKNIIVADESKRLIKAYVLQTFQETLDAIGEVATNILSAIPNMATSTVYFEGCKETKSGSIKDEVVAILNTDGNNEIPIKSLSGGERTAIDLAIDLAVIDVIETKVAKGANFLFMDEPFDGLDSVCKENCLEILKQIDTNKKIIMVDHSSELKEMVSDIILVVKKGEISNIAI
jgi:DNA repair exonuclease SbcCD ATPase subunit